MAHVTNAYMPARVNDMVRDAFAQFVAQPDYPCLGARSALRRRGCCIGVYGAMGTTGTTNALAADLAAFVRHASDSRAPSSPLVAFAAVFVEPAPACEAGFEHALWAQLTRLNGADPSATWADGASDDPDDPHFAFSFADTAFFIIGLHPESSRLARRFGWPALVFNPHAQFARLRAEQRFEGMRQSVRARDIALQGDINPNLADVGERSEARQYSGRRTDDAWRCPFHRNEP